MIVSSNSSASINNADKHNLPNRCPSEADQEDDIEIDLVADQIAVNVSLKDKEVEHRSGKSGQFLINKEDLFESI